MSKQGQAIRTSTQVPKTPRLEQAITITDMVCVAVEVE